MDRRYLRSMKGISSRDRIRDEEVRDTTGGKSIEETSQTSRIQWVCKWTMTAYQR
jgi:hypothetical protein